MNQLLDHPNMVEYFWPDRPMAQIQDDHVPFLNKGMPPRSAPRVASSCVC